jgi:hypothetical protein
MSRGDAWSVAVTLIATWIVWRFGGGEAAWICLLAGLGIALFLHLTRPSKKESDPTTNITVNPNISPNISPTISPTFNVGMQTPVANRPKISFKKWETRTQAMEFWQSGFILENHGAEAALDVTVVRFEIEKNVFAESSPLPTIGEGQEGFALVWIEGLPSAPFRNEKWDLLAAMKKAADARDGGQITYRQNYTVPVSVMYKDFEGHRYMSTADLSYIPSRGELTFGAPVQRKLP